MKLLYLDTETTGLSEYKNGLVEIAGIIEIDGEVKDVIDLACAPFPQDEISDYALETQGVTEAQMRAYEPPKKAYDALIATMSRHVNRYDKADKFVFIGYNIQFDIKFLEKFFEKHDDKYFGSWCNRRSMDIMSMLYWWKYRTGVELENWKLGTVCEHFGIDLSNAHTALADIKATRQLFRKLDGMMSLNIGG